MGFLSIPLLIGIGGGILSGLVVTGVSRFVLSRRENREYLQKVFSANQELIYSMRPGISEGVIPEPVVINSLITATARKHRVDAKDIYGPPQIVEELLKEVMDSSFISAKTKQEYCQQLNAMNQSLDEVSRKVDAGDLAQRIEKGRAETLAEYRERTTTMMSVMMGTLAAIMTALIAVMTKFRDLGTMERFPRLIAELLEKLPILLPTLLSVVAVIVSVWIVMFQREAARRKESSSPPREDRLTDDSGESVQKKDAR